MKHGPGAVTARAPAEQKEEQHRARDGAQGCGALSGTKASVGGQGGKRPFGESQGDRADRGE